MKPFDTKRHINDKHMRQHKNTSKDLLRNTYDTTQKHIGNSKESRSQLHVRNPQFPNDKNNQS